MSLQVNTAGEGLYQFSSDVVRGASLMIGNTLKTAWYLLNLTEQNHDEQKKPILYMHIPQQSKDVISQNLDVGQPKDPSYIKVNEATSRKFKEMDISLPVNRAPHGNYTPCTEAVINQLYFQDPISGNITERTSR